MTAEFEEVPAGSPIETKLAELRHGAFREQLTQGEIKKVAGLLLAMLEVDSGDDGTEEE